MKVIGISKWVDNAATSIRSNPGEIPPELHQTGWVGPFPHLSGTRLFRQAIEPLRRPFFRGFTCAFHVSLGGRVQTMLADTFPLLLMALGHAIPFRYGGFISLEDQDSHYPRGFPAHSRVEGAERSTMGDRGRVKKAGKSSIRRVGRLGMASIATGRPKLRIDVILIMLSPNCGTP